MLALKIAVFLLTLSLGIIASGLGWIEVREERVAESVAVDHTSVTYGSSNGSGYALGCHGTTRGPLETELPGERRKPNESKSDEPRSNTTSPLKILYKQKAQYTAEARSNGTQGTVTLRVTFLASGAIGSITMVKGLPFGLTEQAINAARKIEFEAEKVNGIPRTTTRPVSYTFNIY